MVALVQQDGVGRNLGARSCGGGQTGEPESFLLDESCAEAVFYLLVTIDECSHQLADVEHRATAYAYDAVGTESAGAVKNLLEVVDRRLCHDVLIDLYGHACCLEFLQSLIQQRTNGRSCQDEQFLIA